MSKFTKSGSTWTEEESEEEISDEDLAEMLSQLSDGSTITIDDDDDDEDEEPLKLPPPRKRG